MAEHRTDPSFEVGEADLLEQATPLDPQPLSEDDRTTTVTANGPGSLVDEADWSEQMVPLPGGDEDDYPYEPPEPGVGA